MADISLLPVAKILEGALEGDLSKVRSYAELIISKLEKDGDVRGARIIRCRLDGTYKDLPKVTLD